MSKVSHFPAGLLLAVTIECLAAGGVVACSGCGSDPPPVVVAPNVVTPDHCALIELQLDGGVTKNICLTADQVEKAIAQ